MAGNNPVIGRKPTTAPTPPLGTGTVLRPGSTSTLPSGLGSAIDTGLGNVGVQVVKSEEINKSDFVTNLTDKQMQQILPYLKKFGATKPQLSVYSEAKKYLETNLSTLVESSENNFNKLISLFKSQATGYDGDGDEDKVKPSGVTQYVTEKSPALLKENVDKFLLATIGSTNVREESRKKIMDEIQKMIDEGVTTTTKMDESGNVKTTQTVGYSEERAGAVVHHARCRYSACEICRSIDLGRSA